MKIKAINGEEREGPTVNRCWVAYFAFSLKEAARKHGQDTVQEVVDIPKNVQSQKPGEEGHHLTRQLNGAENIYKWIEKELIIRHEINEMTNDKWQNNKWMN